MSIDATRPGDKSQLFNRVHPPNTRPLDATVAQKLQAKVRWSRHLALASHAVAVASDEMILDSIRGKGFPVRDWLTSYPLILVALDPFTNESAWILETAGKLLEHFQPSDVRTAFLVAGDDDECREFLGPWAENFLTFADPDRKAIGELGLQNLPGLAIIRPNMEMFVADGWDPAAWNALVTPLAEILSWSKPLIPAPGDPAPFVGTPAQS